MNLTNLLNSERDYFLSEFAGEKDELSWNMWLISSLNLPLSGEDKYDLINYWNCTGFTGDEINDFYKTTVDDQLAVLHFKQLEKFGEPIDALKMVTDFFIQQSKILSPE